MAKFALFSKWYGFCGISGNHEAQSKELAMSKDMRYLGLCSSCKNASSCTFRREADKPVLYCEEFEIEEASFIKTPAKKQLPAAGSAGATEKDSSKFIGLCSDCENRRTCIFPKPEGGVWHCEEYQ